MELNGKVLIIFIVTFTLLDIIKAYKMFTHNIELLKKSFHINVKILRKIKIIKYS